MYNNVYNAAIRRRLQNTVQQHATDNYTSHLRRKQDQLPIILNKSFNIILNVLIQKGKQTHLYILITEAKKCYMFL
jgi:hypothetical protein